MVTTKELNALMALAEANQSDIGAAMNCSFQMISKAINSPGKYPIKSMQIHRLLTEWAKGSGLAIVKAKKTSPQRISAGDKCKPF